MNRISLKLLTVCGITCFMACTTTQKPKDRKMERAYGTLRNEAFS